MALPNSPPILPLRPSDDNSKYLAKDLMLGYLLLEGGSIIKNYGYLGGAADLTLSNVSRVRHNGLPSLSFNGSNSIASNTSINIELPNKWSFAYWLKLNSAPSTESNIINIQGSTGPNLRAWVDSQGIWAWKKHSIADAYSILPAADFPISRMILVVAVYDDILMPPAQLRTTQGTAGHPSQPDSYTAFNESAGAPANSARSIYLGGGHDGAGVLNGIMGPFYMWSRPLSDTEVWQLWQDPYAPFRRSTEQIMIPSTMISSQGFSLQGAGKQTGTIPIITDDEAIVIGVNESLTSMRALPVEELDDDPRVSDDIIIYEGYSYQDVADDSISVNISTPPEIVIFDHYEYKPIPVEQFTESVSSVNAITVQESYNYLDLPSEVLLDEASQISSINIEDNLNYESVPNESVSV